MSDGAAPRDVRLAVAADMLGVGKTTAQKWFDDDLLRGRRLPGRGDRVVEVASVRELDAVLRHPSAPHRDALLEALREHNRRLRDAESQ